MQGFFDLFELEAAVFLETQQFHLRIETEHFDQVDKVLASILNLVVEGFGLLLGEPGERLKKLGYCFESHEKVSDFLLEPEGDSVARVVDIKLIWELVPVCYKELFEG